MSEPIYGNPTCKMCGVHYTLNEASKHIHTTPEFDAEKEASQAIEEFFEKYKTFLFRGDMDKFAYEKEMKSRIKASLLRCYSQGRKDREEELRENVSLQFIEREVKKAKEAGRREGLREARQKIGEMIPGLPATEIQRRATRKIQKMIQQLEEEKP